MSRALDPRVKELLKEGDHTEVYQCIADALSAQHDLLLDIEILGPSHALLDDSYFLYEDNAIAIPKLNILRAFLPAYNVFKSYLAVRSHVSDEVMRATSVILLLDPEHMTAANARKRYIRQTEDADPGLMEKTLESELYFIDSLLTSRLHRHTKSPTLWGHRQWLMELRISRRRPTPSLEAALEKLIFVSAERHPRNYYAWCHARYLVELAGRTSRGNGDEQGQQRDTRTSLAAATEQVKKWCFAHHNDVSGWSFLMVLLEERQRTGGDGAAAAGAATAAAVFSETLHLAETFSWRGESVWYFLRNMLRRDWLPQKQEQEFERVLRLVHGKVAEPEDLDQQVMGNMLAWSKLYSELETPTTA